jgi:hypothetical protein
MRSSRHIGIFRRGGAPSSLMWLWDGEMLAKIRKAAIMSLHANVAPTSQTASVEWRNVGEPVRFHSLKRGATLGYGVSVQSPAATSTKIKIRVSDAERLWLDKQARAAGMGVANYIRQKLGLRARPMGRPTAAEREDMEDDAWSRLVEVGADPRQYFPPDVEQAPSEDEETPEERDARIARVRAAIARLDAEKARKGQPLQ